MLKNLYSFVNLFILCIGVDANVNVADVHNINGNLKRFPLSLFTNHNILLCIAKITPLLKQII